MQEIIDYIESHWAIIGAVLTLLGSLGYLKLDARYARKTEIKETLNHVNKQHSELEHRVDKVEQDMQHLPSAEDVIALRIALQEMKGETRTLHASVQPLTRLVDLLVEKEVITTKKGD